MFGNCSNLTGIQDSFSATSIDEDGFNGMFSFTSVETVPYLPATALTRSCYSMMFANTGVKVVPRLPATTLAQECYRFMFSNCSALTTVTELPAPTIATEAYEQMFQHCTNLNYVKCLALNPTTSNCSYWLYDVAANGTFVRRSGVSWPGGGSGIPGGWTIQNA